MKCFKIEHMVSEYCKTNKPDELSPEEERFEQSTICWLCESPLGDEKVRDDNHLTGKYRGAAHKCCILNCKQKSSGFVTIFFHSFSRYDCHLLFEPVLTRTFKLKNISSNQIIILPKSKENYISVQVGCSRFLDSYRFLPTGLYKLLKSLDSFPIMDENGFIDEIFKKTLAYPYEYFTVSSFQEPLNLTKEDFWPTLKQSCPSDEEISRTQKIF